MAQRIKITTVDGRELIGQTTDKVVGIPYCGRAPELVHAGGLTVGDYIAPLAGIGKEEAHDPIPKSISLTQIVCMQLLPEEAPVAQG